MEDSYWPHVPLRKFPSLSGTLDTEEKIFPHCYFILILLLVSHQSYNHDCKSFGLIFVCFVFFCLPTVDMGNKIIKIAIREEGGQDKQGTWRRKANVSVSDSYFLVMFRSPCPIENVNSEV